MCATPWHRRVVVSLMRREGRDSLDAVTHPNAPACLRAHDSLAPSLPMLGMLRVVLSSFASQFDSFSLITIPNLECIPKEHRFTISLFQDSWILLTSSRASAVIAA